MCNGPVRTVAGLQEWRSMPENSPMQNGGRDEAGRRKTDYCHNRLL